MIKAIKNTSIESGRQRYGTPQSSVIFVKAQGVLRQSGNASVREHDYGDAGFDEV